MVNAAVKMDKRGKYRVAWTEAERAILSQYWRKENSRQIGDRLGRSPASIRAKACGLRLPLHKPARPWTVKDIKRLKEVYPVLGTQCAKSFGRTIDSIRKMVQFLGVKASYVDKRHFDLKGHILVSGIKAIECLGSSKWRGKVWLFECHCGNFGYSSAHRLHKGVTKSCGCLNFRRQPGLKFDARRSKNRGAMKYDRKRT